MISDVLLPFNQSSNAHASGLQTAKICVPGYDSMGALSSTKNITADHWMQHTFLRLLYTPIKEAYHWTQKGGLREIIDLDQALHPTLAIDISERLIQEGRKLCLDNVPPRGERLLSRFKESIEQERVHGYFPILFAIRSAIFHVPFRQMLITYIFLEGKGRDSKDDQLLWVQECLAQLPSRENFESKSYIA